MEKTLSDLPVIKYDAYAYVVLTIHFFKTERGVVWSYELWSRAIAGMFRAKKTWGDNALSPQEVIRLFAQEAVRAVFSWGKAWAVFSPAIDVMAFHDLRSRLPQSVATDAKAVLRVLAMMYQNESAKEDIRDGVKEYLMEDKVCPPNYLIDRVIDYLSLATKIARSQRVNS